MTLAANGAAHAAIDARWRSVVDQVRTAVQMPSFSDTGEGIGQAAEYFAQLLSTVCPDAAVVPTPGHPVVFGTCHRAREGAPTLLVYGLYDVTPTIATEWTVDPMAAEIVQPDLLGLDPELGPLLVGRGVNNHKGPVIAAIAAVAAALETGVELPVNLVFVIEGEEEVGSPSLQGFLDLHRVGIGPVDGIWLPCMQQNSVGTMALRRGYKGCLWTELTCVGGDWGGPRDGRHLWAGHSAWIDAPMMRLVQALACLYDADQRVQVDGMDAISRPHQVTQADDIAAIVAGFGDHPEWSERMLATLGVTRALGGKDLADHLEYYMTGVTLNIQGIVGGYQGPSYYTMMPGQAAARLDFRFPAGVEPQAVAALVRAHLDRRGFTEVTCENRRGYAGLAPRALGDDPLLAAAQRTAARYGVPTQVWPMANNCCPAALFSGLGTDLPFSVAGLGHGERPHAPDEYITVDSVRQLMHFTVDYLADTAVALRPPRDRNLAVSPPS